MILSKDFGEKLSDLSLGHVVSDSESESFQKIFLAKIERVQGSGHDAYFSRIVRWIDVFR